MQNQMCRVCDEPAAGFHFGAFTCEGCKSFFGRTCNNQSVIQECKNNYRCVVDKKNRTACKACRLRKCLMVGMSKSGSRYGRRSNWFKIHCLMQQSMQGGNKSTSAKASQPPPPLSTEVSPLSSSSLSPTSPPRSWTSSKDIRDRHSPKIEDHRNKSPELTHSPTMVPRTTSINSTPSPFASLGLPPPPASPPKPPISEAHLPFYGFPPTFSLMSTPGLHGLPFHKQALLSPLLAHTHLYQQMIQRAQNPLLAAQAAAQPAPDLLAEQQKAFMERFAAIAAQAQSAALAASASQQKAAEVEKTNVPSRSPTPPKTPEPQHAPMDLSNKRSDEEDSESDHESLGEPQPKKKKMFKSDLNRNVVSENGDETEEELDV